jgi:arylsulfatase A-like enzyme
MQRRYILTWQLGLAIIGAALSTLTAISQAALARPNIVLIVADDLGYGDLSINGNPDLRTPNLDTLAGQSVVFEHFFVSPVCAPTRAALLTGRYSLRTGVWGVTGGREYMRPGEVTLAEALRAAGYRTGLFGKWHNGEHYPLTPPAQGFSRVLGFNYGNINDYFDAILKDEAGQAVPTSGYVTDVLTGAAMEFITQNRYRPFFAYLAYNTPHAPYQVPDADFDLFRSRGVSAQLASVYGMIVNLDANIGRLLRHLDTTGLAGNTIVVFMSDNGATGPQRYNAGMRGRKGSVDEGGGRVPLFVRWPVRWPRASRVTQVSAHIDLYPTLLGLAGIPVPNPSRIDGRSLIPLLDGRPAGWPDRMLFTHMAGTGSVTERPGAVRTQQYRWVHRAGGDELYDMVADPGQHTNVISRQPELAQQLRVAYVDWFRDVSGAGFARLLPEVGHVEEDPVVLEAPLAILTGGLRFSNGTGYAHEWINNWTTTADSVSWDVDVIAAGRYRVSLGFACPAGDAGSRVALTGAEIRLEATVPAAVAPYIPLANRAEAQTYVLRRWATLPMGEVQLGLGHHRLQLQALVKPGAIVMELKHLMLERL